MSGRLTATCARLCLFAGIATLTACSSFTSKWRAAPESKATRWDGRWTSEKHRTAGGAPTGGRLRCVLEEVKVATNCFPRRPQIKPSIETILRADFRANWMVFTSDYTMELTPVKGSRTAFTGSQELPAIFGGTYRYTAQITGDRFTARYDSSYDRGIFELSRVRP